MEPIHADRIRPNGHLPAVATTAAAAASSGLATCSPEPLSPDPISSEDQSVPPYWQSLADHGQSGRSAQARWSYVSIDNGRPPPIRLEDHTEDTSESSKALWARHVTVDDYVIVNGNPPGVGAYVVWNCTVETLDGGPMKIRKRFSEFDGLRKKLVQTFPHAEGSMPQLPPKSVISKFRPRFLERRRAGLSYFLNCILLNPEFSGSPVLKDFLFS